MRWIVVDCERRVVVLCGGLARVAAAKALDVHLVLGQWRQLKQVDAYRVEIDQLAQVLDGWWMLVYMHAVRTWKRCSILDATRDAAATLDDLRKFILPHSAPIQVGCGQTAQSLVWTRRQACR